MSRFPSNQRYLTDNFEVSATVDAPTDYEVEEGVLVDTSEKSQRLTDREAHQAEYATWPCSAEVREAEEADWAARSGPVYIKRAPTAGIVV